MWRSAEQLSEKNRLLFPTAFLNINNLEVKDKKTEGTCETRKSDFIEYICTDSFLCNLLS